MRTILTILLATTLLGGAAYAMDEGGHAGARGGTGHAWAGHARGDHDRGFRGDRDDRLVFRDRDDRRLRDRDDFRRGRLFGGWWPGGVYNDACVPGTRYWRHYCQ